MRTTPKYKIFLHDKSIDELQFNSSLWKSKLKFIDVEVSFIKQLINTSPIKSEIPNSVEHLQFFIEQLHSMEKEAHSITNDLQRYTSELGSMTECDKLSCDNFYVIAYEKLAKVVYKYFRKYRKLKTQIYEYLKGSLN